MLGVRFYYLEMLGTAVFAITGVLAGDAAGARRVRRTWCSGIVTALGGGTVRDLIIGGAAVLDHRLQLRVGRWRRGASRRSGSGRRFREGYGGLLYLDALGAALFAVTAANKVLAAAAWAGRWR